MPSQQVRAAATSSAPPAAVFALLADVRTWTRWGAWVRAELESASPDGGGGVGAVRRLESRSFGQTVVARERIEELVPERRVVYALLSGLPLTDYVGRVELEPDAGGTRITWSSTFDAQVWGTGWLYRAILQRFVARTVEALARAAERPA